MDKTINSIHILLATAFTGVAVYFQELLIPIIMLVIVMFADYITGMTWAWINRELNSRIGIRGVVKKVSYLMMVGVAMVIDWVVISGLSNFEVNINISMFGLLVIMWLIINELISIAENLYKIGVPTPKFLSVILDKLKTVVEDKTNVDKNGKL